MNTIEQIYQAQQDFFYNGQTKQYAYRMQSLERLQQSIKNHEQDIFQALKADLNKNQTEAWISETAFLYREIRHAKAKLKSWMKPKKVRTSLLQQPSSAAIHYEPLGQVLVIAPWNYPIQLALSPVVGAIAAGNVVVLKPSELAPHCSKILKKIVDDVFSENELAVVEGGIPETTELLAKRWDHIFFTGSTKVGGIVASAAAKHLTPTTLELGGKSPCIVTRNANLNIAAKRIVWGKFYNAGQTCVAPDYVLADASIKDELLAKMKEEVVRFYTKDPKKSEDYGRIITEGHLDRLIELLDSEKVAIGGDYVKEDRYLAPTIMDNVSFEDPVMRDEIFGPILPILTFEKLRDVPNLVQKNSNPLAAYFFTEDKTEEAELIEKIPFGGGSVNTCLQHLNEDHLPFGGRGESGAGNYHGHASFRCFSHEKSIFKSASWFDLTLKYPPFRKKHKILKKIVN